MTPLQPGEPAPALRGTDQRGELVDLADFRGKKWVVLYFYPADNTPVCTRQACQFRDVYAEFADVGAEIIGVSGNQAASHQDFSKRHDLPFRLISDPDGSIRRAFRVPRLLGLMPGRVTYVIDPDGVVQMAFNSAWNADQHVSRALGVIRGASTA